MEKNTQLSPTAISKQSLPFWLLASVAFLVALVIVGLIGYFFFRDLFIPVKEVVPTLEYPERTAPEVESEGAGFVDQSSTYSLAEKIDVVAYQGAISAAWQELVDKGFAVRDGVRPEILTVKIPDSPESSRLTEYKVDISKEVLVTLTDNKEGFGDTDRVKVGVSVNNDQQLSLEVYQDTLYDDSGMATALSIAFDTMSVIGREYTGPRPAITAFEEMVRTEGLGTLERSL